MSKISELAYDIEQLYIEGLSAARIARELGCPKSIVEDWIKAQSVADLPQDEEIYSPYYGA